MVASNHFSLFWQFILIEVIISSFDKLQFYIYFANKLTLRSMADFVEILIEPTNLSENLVYKIQNI